MLISTKILISTKEETARTGNRARGRAADLGTDLEIALGTGLDIALGTGLEIALGAGLEIALGAELEIALGAGLEIALGAGQEIVLGPELEIALRPGLEGIRAALEGNPEEGPPSLGLLAVGSSLLFKSRNDHSSAKSLTAGS